MTVDLAEHPRFEVADWPMAVNKERVCLRAMTSHDLRQFAVIEEAAATKDYEARMGAVKGAMILADRLDEHGCRTVQDLGRLQEHG